MLISLTYSMETMANKLSGQVNAYFTTILAVVERYRGDSWSDDEAHHSRLLWPSDSTERRPSPGCHTSNAAAAAAAAVAAAQSLYQCPYAAGYCLRPYRTSKIIWFTYRLYLDIFCSNSYSMHTKLNCHREKDS